ncbi:MAG: hypothetical protein BIFFINMI_01198 [Phycisphaerae bacterium]|nr:hypothetical protein [Phycisphaerae bacterium]
MILKQMLQLIRLLGLRRAGRMKRRYEKALPHVRGYAATSCYWTLLKVGLLDAMADGPVELEAFARDRGLDLHVLDSICSYFDGIAVLDYDHDARRAGLAKLGRDLLAEPRGLFELLYAYEPIFTDLEAMLRGDKRLGRDVQRRTDWVGIGSGRLCRQLPYPVMIDMVRRNGGRNVLDLGCGDGALLMELAAAEPELRAVGIDINGPTADLATRQIAAAGLGDRLSACTRDMFDLPGNHADLAAIDCLTACDTFHEYLWDGDSRVVELLANLKAAFPGARMVIGEFCKQSHESLRKRPTAFLEHHLFHQLTNQRIETADRWRDIFGRAGLRIVEEKVFDLVGHGYFVLE